MKQNDVDLFTFGYCLVMGAAFGGWMQSIGAGLFMTLLTIPILFTFKVPQK